MDRRFIASGVRHLLRLVPPVASSRLLKMRGWGPPICLLSPVLEDVLCAQLVLVIFSGSIRGLQHLVLYRV